MVNSGCLLAICSLAEASCNSNHWGTFEGVDCEPKEVTSALTCSTDFVSLVTSSSSPSDRPSFLTTNMASKSYAVKMAPKCALASDCLQSMHLFYRMPQVLVLVLNIVQAKAALTACRSDLRSALAPAVSSGLSWNFVKSYNGASNKQNSITATVMSTDRPACVLVSLHIAIDGRAKGSGSSSVRPKAPSMAQKANNGITKPNIVPTGSGNLAHKID